jgi:SAM-dependent methyltransferase
MARITAFQTQVERYERWFETHSAAYEAELRALGCFLPRRGLGLEVGVGTGRFAAPLRIAVGLDPSDAMLFRAAGRGIAAVRGIAEALPFAEGSFDFVAFVTALCFVDSPRVALAEARRVLRPGGALIIAFIDRDSELGQRYSESRASSPFYQEATFYSVPEVAALLRAAGFAPRAWIQTLFGQYAAPAIEGPAGSQAEAPLPGTGKGAFAVVLAEPDQGRTG